MKSAPTTKLSMDYLRKQGYVVAVVESWLTFPERKNGIPTGKTIRIKRDLWNMADLIAFRPDTRGVYLIQTTTTANQANRAFKIKTSEHAWDWLGCLDRHIHVHGWLKSRKTNRWELTVTEIKQSECVPSAPASELFAG